MINDKNVNDNHKNVVLEVPVQQIVANRYQPRVVFKEEELQELATSIKLHGLLQPIILRRVTSDMYEIIAGERRYRAIQMAGLDTIPAIIKDVAASEAAVLALIENLHREDLNVIEEAKSYAQLMELYGKTQTEIADMIGCSQSAIANRLRLLHLAEPVHTALEHKLITERHGRALLKIKDADEQNQILQWIMKKDLNVADSEKYIDAYLASKDNAKTGNSTILFQVAKDTKIAVNTIKKAIESIQNFGMDIAVEQVEEEEDYVFNIKIPKHLVEKKPSTPSFPHLKESINESAPKKEQPLSPTPAMMTMTSPQLSVTDQGKEATPILSDTLEDMTKPIIVDLDLTSETVIDRTGMLALLDDDKAKKR